MVRIIEQLDEIAGSYRALFCDLWGCLHDGVRAFPHSVDALARFKAGGGSVLLITNSPRPRRDVVRQLDRLGVPREVYDTVISSGDAAQDALARGMFGERVYHLGPQRDLVFFEREDGSSVPVERVPLEDAESIVCTGLFDDRTETPDDYRSTILYGVNKGLKLLCANPDLVVDVGDQRIYCAGAIAKAYAEAGGDSFYFGKPHAPIYQLAQRWLGEHGLEANPESILCIGDGIHTDVAGASGEGLDSVFVTGGLAAEETATAGEAGPDAKLLEDFLRRARLTPIAAMPYLR